MTPIEIILVILVVLLLAGGWGGRTYVGTNGSNLLYVMAVLTILFLLLRFLHVV